MMWHHEKEKLVPLKSKLEGAEDIALELIELLLEEGLHPYMWSSSKNKESAYIRFVENEIHTMYIGSIRISNHEGRANLNYKFNLRSDIRGEYGTSNNCNRVQHFVHTEHKAILVSLIKAEQEMLKEKYRKIHNQEYNPKILKDSIICLF